MTRKDAFVSAGIALAAGVVVAGILMINRSQMTEAITLTMFPAVLAAPTQWFHLRGHSRLAKLVLMGAPFVVCFLIGLGAGMVVAD